MKSKLLLLGLLLIAICGFNSCKDEVPEVQYSISGVSVEDDVLRVDGEPIQIKIYSEPEGLSLENVMYELSSKNISVERTETGFRVTGIDVGETTMTISYGDFKKAITFNVKKKDTRNATEKKICGMQFGKTSVVYKFDSSADMTGKKGDEKFTWRATKEGKITITLKDGTEETWQYNAEKETITKGSTTYGKVYTLSVSNSKTELEVNGTTSLTLTSTPNDGFDFSKVDFTFSESNILIGKLSGNTYTLTAGESAGQTTLTISYGDWKKTIDFKVKEKPADKPDDTDTPGGTGSGDTPTTKKITITFKAGKFGKFEGGKDKIDITGEPGDAFDKADVPEIKTITNANYTFDVWDKSFPDNFTNNMIITAEYKRKLKGKENGHDWIDLGLESGLCWATCNIGAKDDNPEEYGAYYAWGETYTKETYTKDNYTYKANPNELDTNYDAAYQSWKGTWRMPTKDQFTELKDNCYWQWTTTYNGKSVNGYIVYKVKNNADKGKSSSPTATYNVTEDEHIFLPATGERYGGNLVRADSEGNYWSRSLEPYTASHAYHLHFSSSEVSVNFLSRYSGRSVRAVCLPASE